MFCYNFCVIVVVTIYFLFHFNYCVQKRNEVLCRRMLGEHFTATKFHLTHHLDSRVTWVEPHLTIHISTINGRWYYLHLLLFFAYSSLTRIIICGLIVFISCLKSCCYPRTMYFGADDSFCFVKHCFFRVYCCCSCYVC